MFVQVLGVASVGTDNGDFEYPGTLGVAGGFAAGGVCGWGFGMRASPPFCKEAKFRKLGVSTWRLAAPDLDAEFYPEFGVSSSCRQRPLGLKPGDQRDLPDLLGDSPLGGVGGCSSLGSCVIVKKGSLDSQVFFEEAGELQESL